MRAAWMRSVLGSSRTTLRGGCPGLCSSRQDGGGNATTTSTTFPQQRTKRVDSEKSGFGRLSAGHSFGSGQPASRSGNAATKSINTAGDGGCWPNELASVGEGESPCCGVPKGAPSQLPVAPKATGGAGHTPKREAQGSNEQHSTGNGGAFATASYVEQGLEVEGVGRSSAFARMQEMTGVPTARGQGAW